MKTKPSAPAIERRFHVGQVELRAAPDAAKPAKVRGYAAVFGKRSENLGTAEYQWFEVIEKGAFADVLKDDVRALFNHDANLILARSKGGTGTLTMGEDETGLWYEFETPDTNAGRDLAESLRRGDVDQSSFAFSVRSDGVKWEETAKDGITTAIRTISKVARLYDVSPVTYPAYADTTVAQRSLDEFKAAQTPPAPPAPPAPSFILTGARAARFGIR